MDLFNSLAHYVLSVFVGAFAWAPPVVGLTVLSAGVGVALLWVFQKTSNQKMIRATKRRVHAHLLELRIFREEPGIMWKAQKSLIASNLRYLGLMLVPALWMAIPLTILVIHMDSFYGRAPMPVGADTIVTMRLRSPLNPAAAAPALISPPGVSAETPAVRVLSEQEVSWRIRAQAAGSADLQIQLDGGTVTKRVEAGGAQRLVPGRRVSSMLDTVWHPDEPRITLPSVDWIEIQYPEARVKVLGFNLHWLVWFTLVSMASGLLLRKAFHVVL